MLRQLRRFAFALAGVFLLQLVLGAAGACSMAAANDLAHAHDHHASAAAHAVDGHAQHGVTAERADPGDDPGGQSTPPSAPPAPRHGAPTHCATAAGCAFDAALAVSRTPAREASPPLARIAAPDDRAPASVVGAPEPPPPRG